MNIIKLFMVSLAIGACNSPTTHKSLPEVTQLQSLLAPEDFALSMIGGLINSGVSDANAIQSKINEEGDQNPYNHVDIDKDGKRDFVEVKEIKPHEQFDFIAKPSAGQMPEQQIATATFKQENGQTVMDANYTNAVSGYNDIYYHQSLASDLAFMMWLNMATRPMYYGTIPMGYRYSTMVPRSTYISNQRSYQTTTRINPVSVQKPPATLNSSRFVNKSSPTFSAASKGVSSDFRTNSSGAKPSGAAFDNAPKSISRPSSVSTPSRSSFSSSFSRSSGSSFRSSRR